MILSKCWPLSAIRCWRLFLKLCNSQHIIDSGIAVISWRIKHFCLSVIYGLRLNLRIQVSHENLTSTREMWWVSQLQYVTSDASWIKLSQNFHRCHNSNENMTAAAATQICASNLWLLSTKFSVIADVILEHTFHMFSFEIFQISLFIKRFNSWIQNQGSI